METTLYEFTANGCEYFPPQIPGFRLNSGQMQPDFILTKEGTLPKNLNAHFLLKSPTQVKAFRGVRGILLISNSITAPRLFAVLVSAVFCRR